MIVLLSQVVWALSCLVWATNGQSENPFGGLYLYLDTNTADEYYREQDEHFYVKNGIVQTPFDEIPIMVVKKSLPFVWYGTERSIQTAITAVSDDSVLEVEVPQRLIQVPSAPECRCTSAIPSAASSSPASSIPKPVLLVNFTCRAQGDVKANITFRFLVASDLSLIVSLTKRCSTGVETPAPTEENVSSGVNQVLYIIPGLVAGVVVVIIVIVVIYHWRVLAGVLRRRRSQSDDDVDMSRDALHEAVFGVLQQYQEEPVSYACRTQEPPAYTQPIQEPGPPGYTSCDEAPNGTAFPYQLAAVNNMSLVTPGNQTTPSQSSANVHSRVGHRPVSTSWSSLPLNGKHIERTRITIGDLVRQGSFTQVRNGYLANAEDDVEGATPVMIKTVKGDAPGSIVSQLVEGVAVLLHCNHRHCMSILGVHYTDTTLPMFLFPRAKYGTLKHTLLDLQENGLRSRFNRMLSPQDLVYLAMQIARGMYHVTKKAGQVHRDLAARNIFVHDNLHIKVGDSALSWDLFPDDYQMLSTGEMIATKWQPVEVLSEGSYTMYSDVWSFGVVLWELFTLAQSPYSEIPAEYLYTYLTSGQRLSQPSNCPDEVFTLMGQCWALTAVDRPRFSYLTLALEEFHTKLNSFI